MAEASGVLWIVATPIGNSGDITLRAIETLRQAQAVICEERRVASTLLKYLGIQKELILVNEHTEVAESPAVVQRLLQGEHLALISDCGTPVFADPGARLIQLAHEAGIRVSPVPGPASLTTALSLVDRRMDQFIYAGFPPRDKDERTRVLKRFRDLRLPVVLMDTPYRLSRLMEDVVYVFGGNCDVMLAVDLTLPSERVLRGIAATVARQVQGQKGEFVLLVLPPG